MKKVVGLTTFGLRWPGVVCCLRQRLITVSPLPPTTRSDGSVRSPDKNTANNEKWNERSNNKGMQLTLGRSVWKVTTWNKRAVSGLAYRGWGAES